MRQEVGARRKNKVQENGTPPKHSSIARLGPSAFSYTGVCFFMSTSVPFSSSCRRAKFSAHARRGGRTTKKNKVQENGTPPKHSSTARLGPSAFSYTGVCFFTSTFRYLSFCGGRARRVRSRTRKRRRYRHVRCGVEADSRRRPPYVKQSPTKGFLTLGTVYPCGSMRQTVPDKRFPDGDPCTICAFNVEASEAP